MNKNNPLTKAVLIGLGLSLACVGVISITPALGNAAVFNASATTNPQASLEEIVISITEQKMELVEQGVKKATYKISTSKFGIGDALGSYSTPLGTMAIAKKIGENLPLGAVLKNRHFTGEILKPNSRGRDPITSRILWLRGLERQNKLAFNRGIYIHGTAAEYSLGRPASYGWIRMANKDVINLYNKVKQGTVVKIIKEKLPRYL